MVKYKRISKLADETGYTEKAIRRKIEDGVWAEGVHYIKAPDGTIHINTEAYTKWLEGQTQKA